MLRVLFVEENSKLVRNTSELLSINGYDGYVVKDNTEAWKVYMAEKPDVIFLKDKSQGLSGFTTLKMIREIDRKVLVVMMGKPDNPAEIITALTREAHNYIRCDCTVEEILAYLSALVRTAGKLQEDKSVFALNDRVYLNIPGCMLNFPDKVVLLTNRDCRLLERLVVNKGKVVDSDDLILEFWREVTFDTKTYLAKAIMRLRSILKPDTSVCIETVRGRGYMLMDSIIRE